MAKPTFKTAAVLMPAKIDGEVSRLRCQIEFSEEFDVFLIRCFEVTQDPGIDPPQEAVVVVLDGPHVSSPFICQRKYCDKNGFIIRFSGSNCRRILRTKLKRLPKT